MEKLDKIYCSLNESSKELYNEKMKKHMGKYQNVGKDFAKA